MRRLFPILVAVGAFLSGCYREVNVKNVNDVIHVCKTDVKTVRDAFGAPSSIGMLNGVVTNTYKTMNGGMIVAYDHDVVVDVVVNPAGLVEMKNRCK